MDRVLQRLLGELRSRRNKEYILARKWRILRAAQISLLVTSLALLLCSLGAWAVSYCDLGGPRELFPGGYLLWNGTGGLGAAFSFSNASWIWPIDFSLGPLMLQSPRLPYGKRLQVVFIHMWFPCVVFSAYPLCYCIHRWRTRVLPGHCKCGYNMRGNESGVCPECGYAMGSLGREDCDTDR